MIHAVLHDYRTSGGSQQPMDHLGLRQLAQTRADAVVGLMTSHAPHNWFPRARNMDPKSILFRGDDAERYVRIANNINADSMMATLANTMTAVAATTVPATLE